MVSRLQGVKESPKMRSAMAEPVFETTSVVKDGLKGERLGTRRRAVASSPQGSRRSPQSNISGKGEGKPNLVSFASAKILVCLEQKRIQI